MENCTLIDENEDKAIPITAQDSRQPLKFRHPSKERATKNTKSEQLAEHTQTHTHTHTHTEEQHL